MRYLTDLPITDLRVAGDAAETLIDFRAYLPPEGMLVMLTGKFRDDIRDALGMKRLEPAYRGSEIRPLGSLTSAAFDRLAKAAGVLLGRFTPFIDDPELITLLSGLHEMLRIQTAKRGQPREEVSVP
jgi:hypothetical protein